MKSDPTNKNKIDFKNKKINAKVVLKSEFKKKESNEYNNASINEKKNYGL